MAPMDLRLIEGRQDCGPDTISIHGEALRISFRRTIRVPDSVNTLSLLPPDLGRFPLMSVKQFEDKLPAIIAEKGGVFFPMHQREAMWIRFESEMQFAIKIYVGGVNAVSGEPVPENMASRLRRQKRVSEGKSIQDYVVLPQQLWLDGVATTEGQVRQFVAVRTGSGHTVEAQITGAEKVAGIQFEVTRKKYVHNKKISIHARGQNLDDTDPGIPESLREFGCVATIYVDPDMLISEFIKTVENEIGVLIGRKRILTLDESDWESLTDIDERKDPGGHLLDRTLHFYGLGGREVNRGHFASAPRKIADFVTQKDDIIRIQPPKTLPTVFIRDVKGRTIVIDNVDLDGDVRELIHRFALKGNISTEGVRLIFSGKQLIQGQTLKSYDVQEVCRLPGGASKGWYGGFDMGEDVHIDTMEMGFAAGGLIKQYVQRDAYAPDSWDQSTTTAFNLQVLDAAVFKEVTGFAPPRCPIDAGTYEEHGYPFFDIPEDESDVAGDFGDLKSLRELFFKDDGKVKVNPDGPRSTFRTLTDLEREIRSENVVSFGEGPFARR